VPVRSAHDHTPHRHRSDCEVPIPKGRCEEKGTQHTFADRLVKSPGRFGRFADSCGVVMSLRTLRPALLELFGPDGAKMFGTRRVRCLPRSEGGLRRSANERRDMEEAVKRSQDTTRPPADPMPSFEPPAPLPKPGTPEPGTGRGF